jgi:DNA polymerase-3 subunit alpha
VLPAADPWLPGERLQREHAAVGFYLSAHPLDEYGPVLKRLRVQNWADFSVAVHAGATMGRLAGTVTAKQERKTKTGNRMGILQLSDPTGQYEAVLFSEALVQYRDVLEPGASVILVVGAEDRPEGINLRVQEVQKLSAVTDGLQRLRLYLSDETPLRAVEAQLGRSRGKGEVSIIVRAEDAGREVEMRLSGRYAVTPDLAGAMRVIKGVEQVELA